MKFFKIAVTATLLLAGVAAGGWWYYHHEKANRELKAAEDAEAHFQYESARNHIISAAKYWSDRGDVQLTAARLCRRACYFDEAKTYLDAARGLLGQAPVSFEQQLLLAQRGVASNYGEQALYDRARNQEDGRILIYEALVYGNLQKFRIMGAWNLASKWLEEQTDDPRPWFWRGVAEELMCVESMDYAAINDLKKALELNPDYDEARLRLCKVQLREKLMEEARTNYEICLKHHPDSVEAMVGFGRCLVWANDVDGGREWLDKALKADKDNVIALRERGTLALNENKAEEAEPMLRRAYEQDPKDLVTSHHLVDCLRRLGREQEAIKYQSLHDAMSARHQRMAQLKRDLQERPNDAGLMLEIAKIYFDLGGPDNETTGISWLDRAIKADPSYVPTMKLVADVLERKGLKDEAAVARSHIPATQR
jgi:tetratricopeptide (TPR) repeat protein